MRSKRWTVRPAEGKELFHAFQKTFQNAPDRTATTSRHSFVETASPRPEKTAIAEEKIGQRHRGRQDRQAGKLEKVSQEDLDGVAWHRMQKGTVFMMFSINL